MTDILINEKYLCKGEISFSQYIDERDGLIKVKGALQLNRYYDDINLIRTNIYYLLGVDVQMESFGTKDNFIIYNFIAKEIKINNKALNQYLEEQEKSGESNG